MPNNELISTASPSGAAIDSLTANEFSVEVNGEVVTGIFRLYDFTTFRMDIKPAQTRLQRDPFRIAKMVQRDPASPINAWIKDTVRTREDIDRPKRTIVIRAIDDGVEIRRWTIKGAYITEVRYSDFSSASTELVEEVISISYEDIDEEWPNGS